MEIITRELQAHDLGAFAEHLRALDHDDRRLRFGQHVSDDAIERYVTRIDIRRDAVFGVTDDSLALIGAAHVARGRDHAELGVSVLAPQRRRGVGAALLQRGALHARNWGLPSFVTHCLRENTPLMRLARRNGLTVVLDGGEADGCLALPAPDPSSLALELIEERVGRFDHLLKTQAWAFRRLSAAWLA